MRDSARIAMLEARIIKLERMLLDSGMVQRRAAMQGVKKGDTECGIRIEGVKLEDIAGYVAEDTQFLSHTPVVPGVDDEPDTGGCLEWVSASDEEC